MTGLVFKLEGQPRCALTGKLTSDDLSTGGKKDREVLTPSSKKVKRSRGGYDKKAFGIRCDQSARQL